MERERERERGGGRRSTFIYMYYWPNCQDSAKYVYIHVLLAKLSRFLSEDFGVTVVKNSNIFQLARNFPKLHNVSSH